MWFKWLQNRAEEGARNRACGTQVACGAWIVCFPGCPNPVWAGEDTGKEIEELEKILKNAEIIDEDEVAGDVISVGCRVKILDMEFEDEMEFSIVGSTEANSLKGFISNESPLGIALLGKKKGDMVEVESPSGMIQYKILEFERSI